MRICNNAQAVRDCGSYYEILTDGCPIRLWFMTDEILRIRAGFDDDFDEASYSLIRTAWRSRTDSLFAGEREFVRPAFSSLTEADGLASGGWVIRGRKLTVTIARNPFMISVRDQEGVLLHEDIPGLSFREDPNERRMHTSRLEEDDHYYGFGEKSGPIDHKDSYLRMVCGDAMGYDPEHTDGMYKHIPFYIKLSEKTKKAVGYFYHGTAACSFDMGRERRNYWHRYSTYSTDAGDIDLFLIAGPLVRDVITRYTWLTGTSAMLPKAALGYLGSSMYYPELPKDCDQAILDFADTAAEEGIPMDGFQLSSGYCNIPTRAGLKRCTFTWNDDRFPDPASFFSEMEARGILVSANVKPGFLFEHPLLDEMEKKGMFIPASGTWWGGPGYFVDFTDAETRSYWKDYLKRALFDYGCRSIWNDNCEYDSIVDLDGEVSFEGHGGTIGELKPVMANLMCKLSNEATLETDPDQRPFSVCRAGHAGIQRYAQVWTGDNRTAWKTLRANIATMLGLGLSGVANIGSDVGGFYGPAPDAELLLRWVQHGIFMPRFSIHSTNTDNTVTEPWMYSDVKEQIRDAIRFRYTLAPYLYSLMNRAHETGLPLMEPLFMAFQNDPQTYQEGTDFLLGDALLVANVLEKGAKTRTVYLPQDSDGNVAFYDYHTRTRYAGGQTIDIPVGLGSIPLFLVSGAILPLNGALSEELVPHMTDPVTDLHLIIVPDTDSSFTYYNDDGCSNGYLEGSYRTTEITVLSDHGREDHAVHISFESFGDYPAEARQIELDIVHPENAPYFVTLWQAADSGKAGSVELPHFLHRKRYEEADCGWYYSNRLRSVLVKYPNPKQDYEIIVSFAENDLLNV